MFGLSNFFAPEIIGTRIAIHLKEGRGVIMPSSKDEPFGFLPWIAVLVTVIVMLVLYIVIARA
jgi:hypothetical protein